MRANLLLALLCCFTLAVAPACGDDGGGGGSGDDSGAVTGDETGADTATDTGLDETGADDTTAAPGDDGLETVDDTADETPVPELPEGCDALGFTTKGSYADTPGPGTFAYVEISSPEPPFDTLALEFYQGEPYNGPTEPGSYELTGTNYADCGICVLIRTDCEQTDSGVVCDREFYADKGTVEITAMGGGTLSGVFHDLELREVSIHPDTWISQPVPDGQTWCLDSHSFTAPLSDGTGAIPDGGTVVDAGDLPVAADPASDTCVTEGNGRYVGHNIGDYSLQNCLGDTVDLHDIACGAEDKALWIYGSTGWCSACSAHLLSLASGWGGEVSKDNFPAGLDFIVLLAEDDYGLTPTLSYCMQYSVSHKTDPALILIDNTQPAVSIPLIHPEGSGVNIDSFGHTWQRVDPYIAADASGTVQTYTPWSAVLRGSNFEYVWSSYFDGNVYAEQVVNQLLAE